MFPKKAARRSECVMMKEKKKGTLKQTNKKQNPTKQ